jgi:hypothetical protein
VSTSVSPHRPRVSLAGINLPRPRLTVVPRSVSRAPRLPFVVLVVAVLAAGLVGLLLLNTSMERGTYQVTALREQSSALGIEQQALQLKVAAMQDPQEVAQQALQLGMVQNPSPAFISLATGQVLGHSWAGVAGNQPDIGAKIGPPVDRLAKISPVFAGEDNNAGASGVKVGPKRKAGGTSGTKGRDTAASSQRSAQ